MRRGLLSFRAAVLVGVLGLLGTAAPSDAAVIRVEDVTLTSNPDNTVSGSLELSVDEVAQTRSIYALQVSLNLVPVSGPAGGVTITDIGPTLSQSQLLSDEPFTGVVDADSVEVGKVPVSNAFDTLADSAGLLRVLFDVAPGTSGQYRIDVDLQGDATALTIDNENFNTLPIAGVTGGLITIQVPEPAGLTALTAAGLLLRRRR